MSRRGGAGGSCVFEPAPFLRETVMIVLEGAGFVAKYRCSEDRLRCRRKRGAELRLRMEVARWRLTNLFLYSLREAWFFYNFWNANA